MSADKGADFALVGVGKAYGSVCVLAGASATFTGGRAHVICGPSGAGKTTLLRLLLGLEAPDAGSVARPRGARLAATFQEDRLCDNLTATANVRLPHAHLRGDQKASFLARERQALESVGLTVDARPVRELSGGQRRRVALLRCVLADADALFLDEPLRGMDEATVERTMAYVAPLLAGRSVFWVTHDERERRWLSGCEDWRVEEGLVRRA
ncbi:ATP-binding cassette domain-containing protein [Thermophilibacter immobilis]|uniref:ATP-binding cassette domain-containing protein n=1 Tax=Thermophilibacter immobilis TaxID=2779519 RepID=A0A7S7RVF4_9ACTN|nr:ATP-binding cassette domain-containing protein [Thermophilibacter immobilis]QOY61249.1 ATP-binding cassette domain-containing protein [Thermophilibacter immobilis]